MKKLIYIILFLVPLLGAAQWDALLIASQQQAVGCTPDPNEQNTTANAASDPNCNETDGTSLWAGTSITMTSDSAEPHAGLYAIKGVTAGGLVSYVHFTLTITSGDTFTVSFWAKSTQGTLDRITGWTNVSGGPSSVNPPSSWTFYSYDITATATGTAQLRFYASASTSGVAGDNIFVDNLSAIKTN
jgi:hypothetical protein